MAVILNSARKNGVQSGLQEQRLFVKSVICGKSISHKKLDIKGRSRVGERKVPKCTVKLVLEEKPLEEFYKLLLIGKCPPALAIQMKTIMVQSDADFERVQKLSFMTTSEGRYYRRTQFNRLVQKVEKEYRA